MGTARRSDAPLPFTPRGMRAGHAALYVGVSPSAWRELVRRGGDHGAYPGGPGPRNRRLRRRHGA